MRDLLLGRQPKDWDIATDATPPRVEALLSGFAHLIPVGRAFGVMVAAVDGQTHEVATFRAEEGYADGRHPDRIVFSSAFEDARRRDFTINALFYDPFRQTVVDHVGGLDDLRRGVLRAVGTPEERFREDHLRLLRTVRFAARTGFAVEAETWQATCRLAELVKTVAAERVAAELEAMLSCGAAREAFGLMADSGLLAQVLPEADRLRGVEQPPQFHPEGDVWTHTLIMLGLFDAARRGEFAHAVTPGPPSDADGPDDGRPAFSEAERAEAVGRLYDGLGEEQLRVLGWALLLHDIGKPDTLTVEDRIRFNNHDSLGAEMARTALERLRRPRAVGEGVGDLVGRHMHFASLRRMRTAKLRRWLREGDFPLHLELHRLDCESSHRMLANWQYGWQAWREELSRPVPAKPLVGGRDLLAMGVGAGPELGRWLRAAEDARLEGEYETREEGLQWVRARLRHAGTIGAGEP